MPKKKGELSIEERLEQSIVAKEEEPYKLPSNWVWTRLGDITNVVSGGTPSTSKEEYYNGNIPWITPKDLSNYKEKYILNGARNITEEGLKKSSAVLLPINSVLMSSRAPIGYVVINKKEVSTNQGFKSFTPSISYIPEYLYHYLKKSKNYLESIATGTTFKELSGDKAKKIIFPLPPLEEQKRIVEKLDSLFEKIQKIKEIIEEVKEKTTSRREAILSKAFSGELTEKWRGENHSENARELLVKINDEKLKLWEDECKKAEDEGRKKPAKPKLKTIDEMLVGAEEMPYKLPNNWVWTRLGDITNVVSGGTPSTSKEEYYNGNIPWITPKDLSNYKEKYILNGARNITEEGLKKSSAVLLPINSVLMSSRAPIGYVVINKKEVSTNQGFKSFTPSISYIPEYLYHYLKKSKNYLESIATGTTFKELSGDKAKKIIFPLPPLEEQKEIVRVLDKIFEEENRISELISLENKIEILEKTILDRAFCGELGTGNNDDEPAIELLKKCLEER